VSTSSSSFVLALALTGCNGLLGLDPSIADQDHDGVADVVDNCPFDDNAQQRDTDGNGLGDVCDCAELGLDLDVDGTDDACDDCVGIPTGVDSGGDGIDDGCEACAGATGLDADADGVDDACDACSLGPPHDEDGDGVADACDNCPTRPNPDQAASKPGAMIGDACNRGGPQRSRFDPLVDQDPTLWPGNVPAWTWVDDGVVISSKSSRATVARLSPLFLIEARADVGVFVSCDSLIGNMSCMLSPSRELQLSVVVFQVSFVQQSSPAVPGTGPIRFQLRIDPTTSWPRCDALDDAGNVITSVGVDSNEGCSRLKVGAVGPSRLEYLWIVTE